MARAASTRPSPLSADDWEWNRFAQAVIRKEEVRVYYLQGIVAPDETPAPLDKHRGTLTSVAGVAVQINNHTISIMSETRLAVTHLRRAWVTEITFFGWPPPKAEASPAPVVANAVPPPPPARIPRP